MFEKIGNFFNKMIKPEVKELTSKDAAKERLHLVLMQDRANVSVDFLELMKQEIIDVIKKYIVVDESAIDVRLTNQENEDGTNGAPSLYANIPILNIKNDVKAEKIKDGTLMYENGELEAVVHQPENSDTVSNTVQENVDIQNEETVVEEPTVIELGASLEETITTEVLEQNNTEENNEEITEIDKEAEVENSEKEQEDSEELVIEKEDKENSDEATEDFSEDTELDDEDGEDVTFDDLLKKAEEEEELIKNQEEVEEKTSDDEVEENEKEDNEEKIEEKKKPQSKKKKTANKKKKR